jgi:hypothetical protein
MRVQPRFGLVDGRHVSASSCCGFLLPALCFP